MTFTYCAGLLTYECVTPRFLERMHKNPMISQGWINRRRWLIFCRFFAIISIAACAYPISAAACFDDEKWAALQANPAPGLLYVWSPRMVLSAHNAATAHTAATARGLAFWAVHDGRVPEDEINQALAQLATHPDGNWFCLFFKVCIKWQVARGNPARPTLKALKSKRPL